MNNIEQNISKLLLGNGVRPSLKGFTYLKEAISIVLDDPISKKCDIYQAIAISHNDKPSSVERAIRSAINSDSNHIKCSNGDYIGKIAESLRYQ